MAKAHHETSRTRRANQRAEQGITVPDTEQTFLDTAKIEEVLAPVISQFGCVLESLTARGSGSNRTLEVVVDYASGTEPLSLDTVAEISRALSDRLDSADDGDAPYLLEVTSAGATRRLTETRHWHRSVGRLLSITPVEGEKFLARLLDVTEAGPQISRKKNTKKGQKESYRDPQVLPWESISSAKVDLEFNR